MRCPWPTHDDPLYLKYHDEEWGVPIRDDRKIFEFLVLEAFQAGLSWSCILHKRENFRKAFLHFNFQKVSKFTPRDVQRLLNDAGIVRNHAKIEAAIENAKRFMEVQKEFGTFSKYMWSWVEDGPATTEKAIAWAKDLKQRGFKFLGPVVIYSHMQAVGMVNDHTASCFRKKL